MKISPHRSIVRTIRQADPDFRIQDGMTLYPRAGFYISAGCPAGYRTVIEQCVQAGWLEPVAHIKDYELMLDVLHD
jgi:hypothetical protein